VNKVILVTGASSGFGRLTAEALAKAGHLRERACTLGNRVFDHRTGRIYGWHQSRLTSIFVIETS
jgi:hypothetical protein